MIDNNIDPRLIFPGHLLAHRLPDKSSALAKIREKRALKKATATTASVQHASMIMNTGTSSA